MANHEYEYRALILLLASIGSILLVGNRLNATFAGGEGLLTHACAQADEKMYCRGDDISTFTESSPLHLVLGTADIWLDENTELEIIDGREGQETVNLLQGRMVVDGELMIATREILTTVSGTTSMVHYSWLNELEIAAIDGETMVTFDDQQIALSNQAIKINTLSYVQKEIIFNPEDSSRSSFYKTVLK
ncbi:MAG: hypothetical protein WC730_00220 [Patescibacteria group bacterium]|jgi:hypothetical protein